MPYQTVWVEPELFLEHGGVKVFLTYNDDDKDQRTNDYLFTVNSDCSELDVRCDDEPCRHFFDVRELSAWQPPVQPPHCIGENNTPENNKAWVQYWKQRDEAIENSIKASIDCGELTPHGFCSREQPSPVQQRSVPE